MQIVVCIKQVPGTTQVEVDEQTGVPKREGVESKLNPYDLYALETALRLAAMSGGEVSVITMGPPQAKSVIYEALMMGVNNGAMLSDPAFAGADVLATARALSQGIKALWQYDLIICGKQTTDGDTAQVGPEIAELLNIPHVTNVVAVDALAPGQLNLHVDSQDYVEEVSMNLPGLISVEKGIFTPRLPSYRRKLAIQNVEIPVLTLSDLEDSDPLRYGLRGSPTQVERVFAPEKTTTRQLITGSPATTAEQLYAVLKEKKMV